MAPESEDNLRLEIGHVLFIDIVGYSKLLIEEQKERLRQLTEIVLGTSQVAKSTNEQLVRLPTGDGMALVFRNSSEEPARCALEIAQALKAHPEVQVRMGIHSGPVSEVTDVSGRTNVAGAGINMAQRVMDCGDNGHILLSKHVAEDLEHYGHWKAQLHDLGECEVKHGVRLGLTNLYGNGVGNPQLPKKFQALKKHRRCVRWAGAAIALLVLAAIVAGLFYVLRREPTRPVTNLVDKSIAVLPFENLSAEKQNEYFADGMQDEILTDLAKVADLKVISRTSVIAYRDTAGRNLRKIGQELGVAHLLEGSVQRVDDRIRVNAQLIDARNDTHLWAQTFDRNLADVFAIQSEIAKAIAAQLRARIAPAQEAQIDRKPTASLEAYDAYLRGMAHARAAYDPSETDKAEAIRNFREAVRLDPSFAQAWSWLSRQLSFFYFRDPNLDAQALVAAREAARQAYQLQPDSAEANLAQGYLLYYGEEHYEEASRSFEKARKSAPGDASIYEALARVSRRMGKWHESADYFQRAVELNPRDAPLLEGQLLTLHDLRDYSAMLKTCAALLAFDPGNKWALSYQISAYQDSGDLQTAAKVLPQQTNSNRLLVLNQATQWFYERRYDEAIKALITALSDAKKPEDWFERQEYLAHLAFVYRAAGKTSEAQATVRSLREELNTTSEREALYNSLYLAEAYALVGEKEKAIATVQPLEKDKDAVLATDFPIAMAKIGALTSDKEMALTYLAIAAHTPCELSYGDLRFNPLWDGLRDDARFQPIVRSLAPKELPGK